MLANKFKILTVFTLVSVNALAEAPNVFIKGGDEFKEKVSEATSELKNSGSDALDELKDSLNTEKKKASREKDKATKKLKDNLEEIKADAKPEIKKGKEHLSELKDKIKNEAIDGKERINDELVKLEDEIRDLAKDVESEYKDFINKKWAYMPTGKDGKVSGFIAIDLESGKVYRSDFKTPDAYETTLNKDVKESLLKQASVGKLEDMSSDLANALKRYRDQNNLDKDFTKEANKVVREIAQELAPKKEHRQDSSL